MTRLARIVAVVLSVVLAVPGSAAGRAAQNPITGYVAGLQRLAGRYAGFSYETVRHHVLDLGFVGPLPPPVRRLASRPPAGLVVRVHRAEFTDDALTVATLEVALSQPVSAFHVLGAGHGLVFFTDDSGLLAATDPAAVLGVSVGVVVRPLAAAPPGPSASRSTDADSYRARLRRAVVAHRSWSFFRGSDAIRVGFVGPVPADVAELVAAAPVGVSVSTVRAPYSHSQLERAIQAILRSHLDCSAAHPLGMGQGVVALCLNDRLYRSPNPRSLLHIGVGVIVRHGISGPPGL